MTDRQSTPPGHHLRPVDPNSGQLVQYDPFQDEAAQDETIDLQELWRSIVKRKWVVISVLVIALVTALLSSVLTVPVYRSTAVVQINHESARILRIEDFEAGPRGWQGVEQFYQTQYEILRSRALAEAVVESEEVWDHPELTGEIRQRSLTGELRALPRRVVDVFRPAPDRAGEPIQVDEEAQQQAAIRRAAGRLRSRLNVAPRDNSRLVNVQVSSFDPQFAARMADAVVREYMASTMQRRYDAGQEAREFLEEQLAEMRIALERSDQALIDFAQESGVADLDERMEMARETLRALNRRLSDAQGDLVQMRAFRRQIENGRGNDIRLVARDERLRDLRNERSELSTEYAALSQRFKDDYPAVVELRSEIDQIEGQIAERREEIINGVLSEYQNLESEVATLQEATDERESRILALNQQAVQYNILQREFQTNRELYDGMLQRMKEIGVAAGVQENNIAMIENALPAGSPYLPNTQRNLAMALMVGLMIGVGLALMLEFLDTTIRRTEDVEKIVGRPVVGLVPMVKLRERKQKDQDKAPGRRKVDDRTVSHYSQLHPKSAVSEAFRSLRTSLMFSTPEGMPKTLLFTSPGPGDGKTTNAINLATVMAQNGSRVLLIDADLRKPRMHRDFNIPHAPGLTNRIAGANADDSSSSAIVPTSVEGLFVMPSGNQAPNPAELLSSERMTRIINMASRAFDHVIIETAPILGLADSLVLARAVDGVIMVTASGKTTKDSIKASTRRMQQVQAPLLGVVMNQVDMDSPDYAYYSAYYYNYSADDEPAEKKGLLQKALGRTA